MPTIAAPPSVERPAVRVLFFGRVVDVFGRARDIALPQGGCSLEELKRRLSGHVEGGAAALAAPGVRAAIDQQMTLDDDAFVRPGQEVAFFSAFSGG
ncbi:MAG: MoaD/ThiS family protein [Pseudomonadota bacterium]